MLTLLQAAQSGHFQAGRVVGMIVVIAVALILVVGVIKMMVKKQREKQ